MGTETELKAWYASVGQRLRQVIVGRMGFDQAAEIAGVSKSTLRRYGDGEQCPFHIVAALSDASGKSLNWFAGRGDDAESQTSTVNADFLEVAVELVEEWLADNGREMAPAKKAAVVAMAYEMLCEAPEGGASDQIRSNVVRLMRVAS